MNKSNVRMWRFIHHRFSPMTRGLEWLIRVLHLQNARWPNMHALSIVRTAAVCFTILFWSACSPAAEDGEPVRLARTEGTVTVEKGVDLYYRIIGSAPDTLVMLHGGPGFGLNYFAPDLLPLAAHYTLLFYDQRSAGRSTLVTDTTRLTEDYMVRDLEAVRRHFGLERVTLVGHSWGPIIAGLYAREHPDRVARMVMIDPAGPANAFQPESPVPPELQETLQAYAETWREKRSIPACWPVMRLYYRNFFPSRLDARRMWGDICNAPQETLLSPARNYHFVKMTGRDFDIREGLDAVTAPTLVLHGNKDVLPMSGAQAWVDALPNARLFAMPGSGHWPQVDNPDVFFSAVNAFLQGVWPAPPNANGQWEVPSNLPPQTSTPYARLFREIERTNDSLEAAVNRNDWSSAAATFNQDAQFLPPAAFPAFGRAAIAAQWQVLHEKGMDTVAWQTMEVEKVGPLALEMGKYAVRTEDDTLVDVGNYQAVWRREEGEWRMYRHTYNSSRVTRSPLEIPHYLPPPTGTWMDDSENR